MIIKIGNIQGIRMDEWTKEHKRIVHLSYEIEKREDGSQVFQLIGGPTGFESFYIDKRDLDLMPKLGWNACMGGGGWDRLEIEAEEMAKALEGITLE